MRTYLCEEYLVKTSCKNSLFNISMGLSESDVLTYDILPEREICGISLRRHPKLQ